MKSFEPQSNCIVLRIVIDSHSLNNSQLPFEYIHQKQRHGEKRKMSHGQKRRTVTCTTTIKTKQTSHGEKA